MKAPLLSSSGEGGERGPTEYSLAPSGPDRLPVSLAIEDQIRRLDVAIGTLEDQRSYAIKCCDGLGAQKLMQDILQLEYERRALRLRWEHSLG